MLILSVLLITLACNAQQNAIHVDWPSDTLLFTNVVDRTYLRGDGAFVTSDSIDLIYVKPMNAPVTIKGVPKTDENGFSYYYMDSIAAPSNYIFSLFICLR